MARYPPKKGRCEIRGCKNTPTEWHHVISQAQIKKRGLPTKYYTDPGNLKEFCRTHHDMTTASMNRKFLEKKASRKSRKKTKRKVNSRPKKKYPTEIPIKPIDILFLFSLILFFGKTFDLGSRIKMGIVSTKQVIETANHC